MPCKSSALAKVMQEGEGSEDEETGIHEEKKGDDQPIIRRRTQSEMRLKRSQMRGPPAELDLGAAGEPGAKRRPEIGRDLDRRKREDKDLLLLARIGDCADLLNFARLTAVYTRCGCRGCNSPGAGAAAALSQFGRSFFRSLPPADPTRPDSRSRQKALRLEETRPYAGRDPCSKPRLDRAHKGRSGNVGLPSFDGLLSHRRGQPRNLRRASSPAA